MTIVTYLTAFQNVSRYVRSSQARLAMTFTSLSIRTLHPEFLGQPGGDTEQNERTGNPDAESDRDLVHADVDKTVNDS